MGYLRPRPKHLAVKLLRIRKALGINQLQLVKRLNVAGISNVYISAFEKDKNEPSLMVLLAYARLANVPVENLIDDELALNL